MDRAAVVIGAGISGTLTGHRLAQAGWRVTLLEARHVGAGSSSRTAAGIRAQFSTPETVLGMRYSVATYLHFPELVGGSQVPIVQSGYLFLLAEDLEPARQRVAMQRSLGLTDVELLLPDEVARRFPWVDPGAVTGATWCPSDGFLRPEIIYNEAADALKRLGGRVVQNAPVEAARGGERLSEVYAAGTWHGADLFVDATNAWSPRLARILGAAELPVAPLKRYLWFLSRGDGMSASELLSMPLVVAPSGAYCRPENGDSLLMGHAHDVAPEPNFSYEDQDRVDADFSHRSGPESRAFETWLSLAERMPALGDFAGISATTSGFYGSTPDHNPFLGYDLLRPNLLARAGRLCAVIDFGGAGAGDPAADVIPAWSVFTAPGRAAFRRALAVADGVWERARGYALHQALLIIPYYARSNPAFTALACRTVAEVLADLAGTQSA